MNNKDLSIDQRPTGRAFTLLIVRLNKFDLSFVVDNRVERNKVCIILAFRSSLCRSYGDIFNIEVYEKYHHESGKVGSGKLV